MTKAELQAQLDESRELVKALRAVIEFLTKSPAMPVWQPAIVNPPPIYPPFIQNPMPWQPEQTYPQTLTVGGGFKIHFEKVESH